MNDYPPLHVKVWGELACFTRPEMKVERVSYPVMTPSAARGILEAIFWKPEFQWQIREIWVLNPIRHFSILRNEINSIQSPRAAKGWSESDGRYNADEDRAQRHTLALRDVSYIIKADVKPKDSGEGALAKYRDQFRRRVQKGRCIHHPYFGCREFPVDFCEPLGNEKTYDLTDDLGLMLFDIDYNDDGTGDPIFFHAELKNGILHIPLELYERR